MRRRRQQRKDSKKKFASCSSSPSLSSHLISLTIHHQLGSQQKCDDLLGFGNRHLSREITIAGLSSSVIKSDSGAATGVLSANHPQPADGAVDSAVDSAVRPPPEPHSSGPSPLWSRRGGAQPMDFQAKPTPASAQEELPTASCYCETR